MFTPYNPDAGAPDPSLSVIPLVPSTSGIRREPIPGLRHSTTCPDLQSHMRANALHHLLSRHHLPPCDDFEDGAEEESASAPEPFLPTSVLRYAPDLLAQLDKRLLEAGATLAPTHDGGIKWGTTATGTPLGGRRGRSGSGGTSKQDMMQRGPCRDDTERFEERLAALAKRPRLVSSGRQHAATHPVTYLTKYLVRPLNEILGCMLLATGLQIFWRLAPEPEPEAAVEDGDEAERVPKGRPRIELIYAPANRPAEVLAFMELTTPHQLPDSSMRILADSLRLGLIKVDSRGSMVLATPLPLAFRSNTCRVLGPVINHMLKTNISIALLTNCSRFMVINHTGVTTRGEKALEFSDLVSGTDVPGEKLTESPLGLLLGVTVFALHKRGISLRAACGLITHATTTSVLQNFLAPHYGTENDKGNRRSQELRLKRRARFDMGLYPTQLGASVFQFRMAPKFISILRSLRTTPASVVNPFHGPSTVGFIPKLLPGSRTDAWFVPELELAQVRGTGDLWDVFSARFAWLPTAPADLIVKLCNLSAFPPDPIDVDESDDSNSYSEKDARIALRAEVVCFNGPLKALQGDIVPSFYGLFGCWQPGGAQQWCTMFEDVGIALTAADANDPDTRNEIRCMYTKLHAHGVLHADVGWRHILRVPEAPARSRGSSTSTSDGTSSGAPGQDSKANADSDAPTPTPTRRALRLVSFDRAIMRHTETPEEWAAKCVSEMQRVEALLELHPIAAGWPRKMERAATPVLSAPATPKRTPASKNVSPAARLVHSNAHAYAANTSANASPKPRGLFRRRQLKRGSTPIPKKYESDTDSSDELKPPARLNIIQRLITPKSSVASLRAVAVKQEVDTHGHAHVHAYEHARSHSGSPSRIYTGPRQLAVGEHGLRHRVSQFFGLHTT